LRITKGEEGDMKKTGIYVRCSTKDQTVEQQLATLREYCRSSGVEVIQQYIDEGESALRANRPAFMRLLEDARLKRINFVLVYKLDRFSRSVKELVNTISELKEYGADFVSYTQREFDTTTSSGKLLFHILGAIAEFERDLISERTKLKLDHLKANGVKLGRPGKYDHAEMFKLKEQGLSINAIAREIGCNPGTVFKVLKKGREKPCLENA